jgi:hypothetical protein
MIRARLIKAKEIVTRDAYRNREGAEEPRDCGTRAERHETAAKLPGSTARVKEIVVEWARTKGRDRQTDARTIFASLFSPVSD